MEPDEPGKAEISNVMSDDERKPDNNNTRTIMGIAFCAVCTIITVGFTVPIIVYVIDAGQGRDSDATTLNFDMTFNCSPSKVGQYYIVSYN